jgi:hypothetical protein
MSIFGDSRVYIFINSEFRQKYDLNSTCIKLKRNESVVLKED